MGRTVDALDWKSFVILGPCNNGHLYEARKSIRLLYYVVQVQNKVGGRRAWTVMGSPL